MDPRPSSAFSDILQQAVARASVAPRPTDDGECASPSGTRCRLCLAGSLRYDMEFPLKAAALKEYWSSALPGVPLGDLIPSRRSREYRFVSKRKVLRQGRSVRLGLIDPDGPLSGGLLAVGRCAIEPAEHAAIYRAAGALLEKSDAAGLAADLHYIVVKGDEKDILVLLNVGSIHPDLVRATVVFSKQLSRLAPRLTALLLYEDTTGGRYYLGTERGKSPRVKKIFGRETLLVRAGGRPFLFGPLSFSQVNRCMIEPLVKGVREMLQPETSRTLFDLYCGYGLFALSLAGSFRAVVGVESGRDAVAAARENAARQRIDTARFLQSDISGQTIGRVMRESATGDAVILDPPRGGTAPGVIEGIAARSPSRVVHIFCNIDGIRGELQRWSDCGYAARQAVPYDLFPGTASVEVMVLLTPLS